MDVLRFFERLLPERRKPPSTESIVGFTHRELLKLPDDADPTPLIKGAANMDLMNSNEPSVADMRELLSHLTPRQYEVMQLNLDGLSYKQIAQRLGVTNKVALHELTQAFYVMRWQGMKR